MSRVYSLLIFLLALTAAALAAGALWFSYQNQLDIRRSSQRESLLLRPMLTVTDLPGGAGLRLGNAGASPAVIRRVMLALPRAEGGYDWLAYPDEVNGARLDLWEFAGLRAAVAAAPQAGPQPVFAPPRPEAVLGGGTESDLLRLPTGPAEWRQAHGAVADRVLGGLRACITYAGLDGAVYMLSLRDLCRNAPGPQDRRYTGAAASAPPDPAPTVPPAP